MLNLQKLQTIKEQNALLATIFQKNNDDERYRKSKLFAGKLEKGTFTIAFAGHFSAGKSSMINALVDEQLLPTSPIPTSANIVTVQNAVENYALVHFVDQPPVRFSGEYDIQLVKKYSKDGSNVSQIEIGHAASNLPEGITIMDTPGVDSTDDAHRISTESALHLADIVFYVMDYNHVQSELNFQFTKQLLHYNENVYLIVNQVDKHREEELPFAAYKQSVTDAFKSWSVDPKDIFYTSLKNKEFIHNDFPQVQQIVTNSIENKEDYYLTLAQATLEKLKDEHVYFLEDEKAACFETFEGQLSEEDWKNKEDIKEQLELAQKQVKLQDVTLWKKTFEELRKNILENASIMTFEMREALKSYAESKQSTFKVGFLGSKKKTEDERHRRLDEVISLLEKIISTNITTHMKLLMKRMLKDVSLLTEEKIKQIDEIDFSISIDLIDNSIQEGASTTGNAILNFANRVTEAVNRYYINRTDLWKDENIHYIEESPIEDEDQIASKTNNLNEKKLAIQTLEEIDTRIQAFEKTVSTPSLPIRKERDELLKNWEEERLQFESSISDYAEEEDAKEQSITQIEQVEEVKDEEVRLSADAVLKRAKRIGEVLAELPAFEEAAETIKRKALRVENQQFTIALFGAFSAGKSSFSNALMGANVLPVSPNPTTAAINKIHPISENHLHNTAEVVLKSEGQILEDVTYAYEQLGITIHSLEEAFEKASAVMKEKVVEEVHKSFVTAFYKGYPAFKGQLGNILHVSGEEFGQFVADESKSCFVDFIDFYYDCELTRLGVTLVDTPGADSINARHTGVAFDYIRNADAVLFVTYFNHAFSKADREFLIQLGRVKDAFELDKMFFVVNAIDLADSVEEASLVKQYVQDELQRFGVRFPRVYGVSSLQGLQEKLGGVPLHEGMQQFEESFHHFLEKDLKQISISALEEEATRQQSKLLGLIEQTETNLARKDQRLIELRNQEQNIRKRYTISKSSQIAKDAKQELDTLLYYVLQRVYYRFNEFFKEAYNPSLFSNNSATLALDHALKDILKMIRFDIEQEMRVSNFRILQYIQQQIQQLEKEEMRVLKDWNSSFTFSPHESLARELLEFVGPFDNISKYEHVKSYYKNARGFFENNEKEKLRDTLSNQSKVEADEYLRKETERLGNWIEQYADIETEALRLKLLQESITQIDAERKLLEQEETLNTWKSVYARL